jgi:hypothetical protein
MSARTGFCILVVAIAACEPRGVTFHLENGDSAPLDSVVVFTTGHKYQLGTLAPGERRTVVVDAKGESHFEIDTGSSLVDILRAATAGASSPAYGVTLCWRWRTA